MPSWSLCRANVFLSAKFQGWARTICCLFLRIEVKIFVGGVFAEVVEMNAGRVPLRPQNLSEAFVEEKVARSGDEGSVDFGAEE